MYHILDYTQCFPKIWRTTTVFKSGSYYTYLVKDLIELKAFIDTTSSTTSNMFGDNNYIRQHLASGEGIVTLGVCVCLSAEPQLHATLVLAAKVSSAL